MLFALALLTRIDDATIAPTMKYILADILNQGLLLPLLK
jgi:hypothetical protein